MYVVRTLSCALFGSVGRALSRHDVFALTQAAAIVLGVSATFAGYARGFAGRRAA
jgi:hypothetical protein